MTPYSFFSLCFSINYFQTSIVKYNKYNKFLILIFSIVLKFKTYFIPIPVGG